MQKYKGIFSHIPNKNKYSDEDKIKFKKPVYVRDDLETLNRLLKTYSKTSSKKNDYTKLSGGGKRGNVFKFPEQNQRVTFKMSYSNSIKSHDKYINYYMPQYNKEFVEDKPELFGMSEEEYEKYKVPLNFKCIISPESNDIKLETLVESFIKRVENQTGYKLCWRAAVHNDTEHRHAHVVINGKDKSGEDVFFNKDTIQLMRLMCSNAATQMIGERTKEQIEAVLQNIDYVDSFDFGEQIDDVLEVHVLLKTDEDKNDDLFYLFAEKKMPVRRISRESLSLEEVFLKLTNDEDEKASKQDADEQTPVAETTEETAETDAASEEKEEE